MSADFDAAIRTALVNDAIVIGLVSEWEGEPAVFTRTPIPGDVEPIMVVVSPNVSYVNLGALNSERPQIIKDIHVHGDQPDQYREVETVANQIQSIFDRNRFAISVDDYNIVRIDATGPVPGAGNDENSVSRVVTITILAQRI